MRAFLSAITLMVLTAGPAAAFGSCRTPGYLQRFDARLAVSIPTECRELLRVNIETGRLRVPMRLISYQATPSADEGPTLGYLRQLAAKTGAAMDLLGDLDLAQVTILLTDSTPPVASADGVSAAHGWASGWRVDDECTIAFFKQASAISEEYFLISVAHEIFHCVQGKTWRAKTGLYPVGAWWIEGSAVYFSHLVVPDTAQLDFLASAFDTNSPTRSLVDMNYDASVFFLWLHEKVGARTGVRRLIDAMPDSGGREAQIAALRDVLSLDRFGAFAEDYLDSKIRQPGGRRVPTSVRIPTTTTFTGPRTRSSSVEPYVLGREMLVFREGKSYDLKTVVSDAGRVRFQEGPGAEWRTPPTEVNACDEDKSYLVAFIATDAGATADFNVTNAEALDRRACCLIGEWQPTAASLDGFARASEAGAGAVAAAGGSQSCSYASGDWTLWFGADGRGGVRWNNYTNRCVTSGPGGSITQTSTSYGAHEFDWMIVDDGAGRWTWTKHDVGTRIERQIGTYSQRLDKAERPPSVRTGGFAYQCTRDTLSVRGIVGINQFSDAHNRFGAPPR